MKTCILRKIMLTILMSSTSDMVGRWQIQLGIQIRSQLSLQIFET